MHTEFWFRTQLENVRLEDRGKGGRNNIKIDLKDLGCEKWFRMMSNILLCYWLFLAWDRLCGLVVRVPGYRSRSPGPIPGVTVFSEK
jgi:hypothetical protein